MFGHNDQSTQNDNDIPDASIHGVLQDEQTGTNQPDQPPEAPVAADPAPAAPASNNVPWQHPGTPLGSKAAPISDVITDGSAQQLTGFQGTTAAVTHHSDEDDDPSAQPTSNDDTNVTHELIDIKQQALGRLSPLIDHLEQSPEEKFRTLMMMIQASDNQSMVKTAYEAAGQIEDDKARAQAFLDIVNEINYFTTQHQD
jgi:hypothetical protein